MGVVHDLIVIGCGPAGACAALAAAREGLDVLVLEKRDVVGSPVRCGEYIPALILKDIHEEVDGFGAQAVDRIEVSLPSGKILTTLSPGLMIKRDRFDSALALAASEAGAYIITSATVTGIVNDTVNATVQGRTESYRGRIIIGADGPRSLVSRVMGNRGSRCAVGLQERLLLTHELDWAFIYYDHQYVGGYAWLFPRGSLANVGLALDRKHSKDLQSLYLNFKLHLMREGIISSEEPLFRTGGLIPAGGIGERIQAGHLLLAGDAAGTANPVTGAGIAPAVISGRLAGELAAQAVASGNISLLNEYQEECIMAFPFERVTAKKREIDSSWGIPRGDAVITDYWRGSGGTFL